MKSLVQGHYTLPPPFLHPPTQKLQFASEQSENVAQLTAAYGRLSALDGTPSQYMSVKCTGVNSLNKVDHEIATKRYLSHAYSSN
jgi:hypothetical protein